MTIVVGLMESVFQTKKSDTEAALTKLSIVEIVTFSDEGSPGSHGQKGLQESRPAERKESACQCFFINCAFQ